ncbi:hypothetical protein [Halalkalibacter krulwichiae]|uniref:Uncharacterized protein n=1 Tax=Halalkalibacter krulwichiae TaxID=199441 RepID=A0A1X9MFB1_9BACI|nr:hypothetical protein [Halalkalibacter krulwichiae]ARK32145.1 hypothetical protein BkAM31D_21130 [Halalkalibacter krulwichiae]
MTNKERIQKAKDELIEWISMHDGIVPSEDLPEYEKEIEERQWFIKQAEKVEELEETVRIYKLSDELVKEQSNKVKHLFPLENTVGYGQLCDKVLELSEEKSFFVKAFAEKIMEEE